MILHLKSCNDPSLVGGKAAGLGQLHRCGFRVPPGLCLTTDVYRDALRAAGVDPSQQWANIRRASDAAREPMLEECRRRVEALSLSQAVHDALERELVELELTAGPRTGTLWAVRSSASHEDGTEATFAGVYRTLLGVPRGSIAAAIPQCWASLWTSAAASYHAATGAGHEPPAMAVIVQPLLMPWSAGVAYSRHPVTGHAGQVVINATFGLAEPLVTGRVTPDQYVIEVVSDPPSRKLLDRIVAEKTSIRVATPTGIRDQSAPEEVRLKPVLGDEEAMALAALVKDVERAFQGPVDVEWAIENGATWLLQARAIPKTGSQDDLI
ncbi:MAG: PEP/pyruvate-binding domain-containing protein, partial [Nitrospiraceae bacterium]